MNSLLSPSKVPIDSGIIAESTVDCDDCIYCDNGIAIAKGGKAGKKPVITNKTCADACKESGGTCCDGDYTEVELFEEGGPIEGGPCTGFTGKVKPNGACSGVLACFNSTISYVSDSCIGPGACALVGSGGGRVGEVVSSCKGELGE